MPDGEGCQRGNTQADHLQKSFTEKFINPIESSLYDVVDVPGATEPDASLRPNQLFAISLRHSLIDPTSEFAKLMVNKVLETLYTDFGLRTLSPANPAYIGTYGPGDQLRRDGAYHQGTVWPWLLGPFVEAHYKVFGDREAAKRLLDPLLKSLPDYGYGSLGEIFDGDFPHAPNGCIAQAWSVAEAVRVLTLLADSNFQQRDGADASAKVPRRDPSTAETVPV